MVEWIGAVANQQQGLRFKSQHPPKKLDMVICVPLTSELWTVETSGLVWLPSYQPRQKMGFQTGIIAKLALKLWSSCPISLCWITGKTITPSSRFSWCYTLPTSNEGPTRPAALKESSTRAETYSLVDWTATRFLHSLSRDNQCWSTWTTACNPLWQIRVSLPVCVIAHTYAHMPDKLHEIKKHTTVLQTTMPKQL